MRESIRTEVTLFFDAVLALVVLAMMLVLSPLIVIYKLLELAYQRATRQTKERRDHT